MVPSPKNIKTICDKFNIQLDYFDKYYTIYFNSPGTLIRTWKEKNNYTYKQCCEILNISHSCFGRLLSDRLKLSYNIYYKLEVAGVF